MVAPIRGPIHFERNTGAVVETKTWYRQKRPYTIPLTFVSKGGYALGKNNAADGWRFLAFAEDRAISPSLYAQAYAKLVGKLGENAGIGITLAQWKQADEMISKRANQLGAFTKQLVRRNPLGIAVTLGVSKRQVERVLATRYGVARSLSDLWLEFWFGWKPMVQDIAAACEVFDNFIPWARYKASAHKVDYYKQENTPFGEWILMTSTEACKVGINVRLVNPNYRLLQQFGLLNVGQVVWDAIPWSFVLGWVYNVDQWLGSITDFAGFETSDGYVSRKVVMEGRTWWPMNPDLGGPGKGFVVSRSIVNSLPRPSLFRKEWSMRPTRALTSIALLSQQLSKVH